MMNRDTIIEELTKKGYVAEKTERIKNGVEFRGIVIRTGEGVAPVIYTDKILKLAKKQGQGIEWVTKTILEILKETEKNKKEFLLQELQDREFILSHLSIAVQKESSQEFIKRPSGLEGIEAFLYITLTDEYGREYCISDIDEILSRVGVKTEEAWKRAEQNLCEDTVIISMSELLDDDGGMPLYIITNKAKEKGAGAILNHKALAEFAKEHNTNKLIVLPSSIHEMLLVTDTDKFSLEEFSQMVVTANEEVVAPEERLTNRAYIMEF